METIAVYWESKVKVYSITHVTDLSMVRLTFPFKTTEKVGKALATLEDSVQRFELVTQDYVNSTASQFNLFVRRSKQKIVKEAFAQWGDELQAKVTLDSPVELIYLHGPHFQDRFGIVEIAFSALKSCNIEIIAAGCAGTTIYVALPYKQGESASQILRDTFIIPTAG